MGIFSRRRERARDEPRHTAPGELHYMGGRLADWQANRSESICAAGARLANTLASAPLHLYKNEQIQRMHSLEKLVHFSPAPGWTPFTFIRDMEFSRDSVGRCYALIERDEKRSPTAMIYLDAGRVTTLRAMETHDLWHRITLDDGTSGYVHDSDMFNLSWLSTSGGVTPVSVLRGSLEYDAQIKEFSLRALDGVHDVILINVPGQVSGDRRTNLIKDILDGYKASGKNALVLDSGVAATRLAGSPVDPKVLDVDKATKTRVAGVYGIQPHLLGDGNSQMTSSEEEMQSFLSLSIVPLMAQWEAELNKKLLSWELFADGMEFRFDANALNRANTQVLAEKYFKAVRGGWMQPNEVRLREGLPQDPHGNKLMMSRDLLPLELLTEKPELLLQGGRGKTNGEGLDA